MTWDHPQCRTCPHSLACFSGSLLRAHHAFLCVNCTQLVLLYRDEVLNWFPSWMANKARNLVHFVEEQFLCFPRATEMVHHLGMSQMRMFEESTPTSCEDPIVESGKGQLWIFLCPVCAKGVTLPSREDYLISLNEQMDVDLAKIDRIIEPEDEKLIKATLDIMEDER